MFRMITNSPEETNELGVKLGEMLEAGSVLTLEGDLGAGKTTFTKGIAAGLGVTRTVNSPTFTIIKEYQGRLPLAHMDVYRVDNEDEDLGFDEYFEGDGVTIVEWAQRIQDQLPKERLDIVIRYVGNDAREFTFTPTGPRYEKLCKELF